jgi:hypothetical protein
LPLGILAPALICELRSYALRKLPNDRHFQPVPSLTPPDPRNQDGPFSLKASRRPVPGKPVSVAVSSPARCRTVSSCKRLANGCRHTVRVISSWRQAGLTTRLVQEAARSRVQPGGQWRIGPPAVHASTPVVPPSYLRSTPVLRPLALRRYDGGYTEEQRR